MTRLSNDFYMAYEELLDRLYTIYREREMNRDTFVAEVAQYFGYDVSGQLENWMDDND